MPKRKEISMDLNCLICGAPTIHAHMGINSCRACAVFYKRSMKLQRTFKCINCTNDCYNGGNIIACRKCRFSRFKEVYDIAAASEESDEKPHLENGEENGNDNFHDDPDLFSDESPQIQNGDQPISISNQSNTGSVAAVSFIDHNSYFAFELPSEDTPILEKMKRSYSAMCLVRKSGEISALHYLLMHAQLKDGKMGLRPAKYSEMIPYSHIFFSAIMDFAMSTFEDLSEMPPENIASKLKHSLIETNFQLIRSLDSSYRSLHNFPNEDTVMATYATYANDDTFEQFFDDCLPEVNKSEAIELFRVNVKHTAMKGKLAFSRVNPTVEEFIALFGLALWNDNTGTFTAEMANLILKNRAAILKELKTVYIRRGITEYAPRMGELLCLIANEERVIDLYGEHVQMYRMMHLFNEAYDDGPQDGQQER